MRPSAPPARAAPATARAGAAAVRWADRLRAAGFVSRESEDDQADRHDPHEDRSAATSFPLPDPPLTDDRVVLRPWQDDDVAVLAGWAKDPEIIRWTAIAPGYDVHHARAFRVHAHRERITGNAIYLAIADAGTGEAVGSCDLRRPIPDDPGVGEVGYLLGPEARGHGFATCAVALLARYGLEVLRMGRVQALVDPGNEPSLRVLARAGFREEGTLRAFRSVEDRRQDRIVLSLLPNEV